jgi:hypothetical protein
VPLQLALAPVPEIASTKHLERLRSNPVLAEYRKQAGMPFHASSDRVARQLLVAMLLPPEHTAAAAAGIRERVMTGRQRQLPAMDWAQMDRDDLLHVLDVVTAHVSGPTAAVEHLAPVRDFYTQLVRNVPTADVHTLTHRDLIQHVLRAHMPESVWPADRQMQRVYRAYRAQHPGTIDPAVVAAVIDRDSTNKNSEPTT